MNIVGLQIRVGMIFLDRKIERREIMGCIKKTKLGVVMGVSR